MKKRILAGLLCVCLLAGLVPTMAFAEEPTVSVWDGSSVADDYESGNGTEDSPYEIASAEQFVYFAQRISSGYETEAYYVLSCDLDLSEANWTPIGGYPDNIFEGTFDGRGHTIRYVISSYSPTGPYDSFIGLFEYVEGDISNLDVEGSITLSALEREVSLGGLSGIFGGNITNCDSNVDITYASNQGAVWIGGLIGQYRAGTIQECAYTGAISAKGNTGQAVAGGICGALHGGTIDSCKNAGTIICVTNDSSGIDSAGGIVGIAISAESDAMLTVRNCYNEGAVSGSIVGGIIGYVDAYQCDIFVENCYSSTMASGTAAQGALIGQNDEGVGSLTVQNCYYLTGTDYYGSKAADLNEIYEKLSESSQGGIWKQDASGVPRLYWEYVVAPDPTTYTLTVDLQGGSGSTAGGEYAEGAVIDIDAGTRANYRFTGWTSSNGGSFADASSASTTFTMPADDTTITANWKYNVGTGKAIQLGTSGISGWDSTDGYDYIYFGNWTASDNYTTSGSIKWRVLDDQTNIGGDGLFLLSDALLGTGQDGNVYFQQDYHHVTSGGDFYYKGSEHEGDHTDCQYANAWQDSTAQKWCDSFYNTNLTTLEQGAVLATTKSDGEFTISLYGNNHLFAASANILNGDKVFFLSAEEAENTDYGFTDDSSREAIYGNLSSSWWLRSSVDNSNLWAGYVDANGIVNYGNATYTYGRKGRPAFNLDLDSVLFTSAADNRGHISFGTAIPDYSGSEWKVTLKDDNDFSSGASVSGTTSLMEGYSDTTLTISHAALSSLSGDYTDVTAALTDASGNLLYYGSINSSTTATESTVTIPAGLSEGTYILSIYGEDWNGTNGTDSATGTPYTVTLTVDNIPPSYSISTSSSRLYFQSATEGYLGGEAWYVTVTNTGNQNVTVALPASTNYTITAQRGFTGGTADLAPDGTARFSVGPKTGLAAGSYNETLTISGSNGASASIELYFTVTHNYGTDWETDADKHWHECSCGAKADEAEHEYDDEQDTTCNVCSYVRTVAPVTYTLTVELNGGSGSTTGGEYAEDAVINIDAGTRSNYRFDGWTSSNGGSFADASSASTTFTMPAADTTITANWLSTDAGVTEVSVNGKAGTIDGTTFTVVLDYGTTALPTDNSAVSITPATGATVSNLTLAENDGSEWTFTVTAEDRETTENYTIKVSIAENPAAGNIADLEAAKSTIEAHDWTVPQTTANTEEEVKAWIEGQLAAMNLNGASYEVAMTGGSFTAATEGDAADRDGTDGSFAFTVKLSKGTDTGNAATSTYAEATVTISGGTITATPYTKWTITVNAENGGTVSGGGTFEENTQVTVTATPNSGYKFVRWEENGVSVSTSEAYTFTATKDRTLVAVFEQDATTPTSHSITVQTEGGGTASASATTAAQGTTITLTATPNSGHHFKEWVVVSGGVTISNNSFTMPDDDVTVKAIFEANTQPTTYTVTINGGGAGASGNGSYTQGTTVNIYAGTRSGYTFTGWSTEDVTIQNADSANASFTMPGKDVTVTATWTYNGGGSSGGGHTNYLLHYYTLTFETNGGSAIEKVTGKSGSTISLSGYAPTREGYDFSGWYSDKGLTNKITEIKLTRNQTVYAGWTESGKVNPDTGTGNPFTDVKKTDWFYDDVMFVYENELMAGTSATTFEPYNNTTRAQIAVIFYRLAGSPAVEGKNVFADVEYSPGTAWYYDAVTWVQQSGIMGGYGNNLFGPNDPVTREQLASIFYNYAKYKGYDVSTTGSLDSFTDKDSVSAWAQEAMKWAVGNGIINGKENNLLDPKGTATRAEIAAMLHRFIEKYKLVPAASTTGSSGTSGWVQRTGSSQTGDNSHMGL